MKGTVEPCENRRRRSDRRLVWKRGVFSETFLSAGPTRILSGPGDLLSGGLSQSTVTQLLSGNRPRLIHSNRYRSTASNTLWLPRCRYRLRYNRSRVKVKAMISQLIKRLFGWW